MTTTTPLIPQMSFICMGLTAIICIAIPLILLFSFKNRFHARIQSFFMGAITYIIFAFVLESFAHESFLSGTTAFSQQILNNPVVNALYLGLAAGIFEEAGRFFCLTVIMKNARKEDAFIYGIGHGGIEAFTVGAWTMVQNIIISMALNQYGSIETYSAQATTAEEGASIAKYLTTLVNTPSANYLLVSVERVCVLILQISLSILMYKAITRKKYLFIPLSVLLHALMIFIMNLSQSGVIASTALAEVIVIVLAVGTTLFAYRQYQSLKYDDY
ncbi:MAG: YhfC family intramembrane metalloprotease [Clostridia bacterium]|nr:YhfC family glutamic-type intramembrane protease [Lachnospiraceae bacterium]NCB99075.1 YhfC family intramembrane metalloprotease [Clostridia bacterium]NCD03491.1 YhfC family intramembrane metalloprotease [Clostridia bacterium]